MATLTELGGWPAILGALIAHDDLTAEQAHAALGEILAGDATPAQIAAFITALRVKGESVVEVTGMVEAMLGAAAPLELPEGVHPIDIVGTGGSAFRRSHALNISTGACFIAAGAGATVLKHGNRRASSTSGSFDVLEALGVAIELDGPAVARCVAEAGIGFCFARAFHPAMRHAGPVRAELGVPTVFNVLGPLSHPAGVTRQVIGVTQPTLAPMVLGVLRARGASRAMVVHGADGLDELTVTGPSMVHELRDGSVREYEVRPADVGVEQVDEEALRGGDPETNAAIVRRVLDGADGAPAEVMVLNAAAGLVVAGLADDLADGVGRARASISSGAARGALDRLIEVSAAAAG